MQTRKIRSGIPALDRIIGGILVGDNLVWHIESGSFMEVFSRKFLRTARREGRSVVIVAFNASPKTLLGRLGPAFNHPDVVLVDGFTWGKGEGAQIFTEYYESLYPKSQSKIVKVPDPHRMENFVDAINRVEEEMAAGTSYLFDSLTGMGHIWGEEKVLTFFTRQCPRLFELNTVAYWILEKSAHSAHFRAQINHITQVALDLSLEEGTSILRVIKAEGRGHSNIKRRWPFHVKRSRVTFLEEGRKESEPPIGPQIRAFRRRKGLSQVQLAEVVGVSPSTISQVEGEQILLSLPALVRLASALDVSLDTLVSVDSEGPLTPVYTRDMKKRIRLGPFSEQQIVAYALLQLRKPGDLEAYELHLQPGARLQGHFFLNKGEEFGHLMQGELLVRLKGQEMVLRAGDCIHLTHDIPERWVNPQDTEAELIWIIHG